MYINVGTIAVNDPHQYYKNNKHIIYNIIDKDINFSIFCQ